MKQLQVREARGDERDAIQDVTLSAYQEYALAMSPEHWERYRQGMRATLAEEGPAECIVAEQGGVIVGSVLLYPAGATIHRTDGSSFTLDWPEVRLLAVAPAARGQGIGAALVEECLRRARRAGAAVLTLHTTDIMQVAMRMYERMGFVRVPELDFSPLPGVTVKGYSFSLDVTAR
jgi:GNAT superfamily N-acetyltransferase